MLIDWIFLPISFILGLLASYQDLKTGKISNKLIIFGVIWSAISFCILFAIDPANSQEIVSGEYIWKVLLNAAIALTIGYLLWKLNLWAAGDAKLFALFALLIPHSFYWKSYFHFFPSFVLLVNIFFAVFLFFFFSALIFHLKNVFYFCRKYKSKSFLYGLANTVSVLRKKQDVVFDKVKNMLGVAGVLLTAQLLIILVSQHFLVTVDKQMSFFVLFGLMLIFQEKLQAFLKKKHFFVATFVAIGILFLLLVMTFGFSYALGFVYSRSFSILAYALIFNLTDFFINLYVSRKTAHEILVNDLAVGHVPCESFFEEFKSFLQRQKSFSVKHSEGLDVEQVEMIKAWGKESGQNKILILVDSFSFAVWIFAGALLTIFLKMSVINLLWK